MAYAWLMIVRAIASLFAILGFSLTAYASPPHPFPILSLPTNAPLILSRPLRRQLFLPRPLRRLLHQQRLPLPTQLPPLLLPRDPHLKPLPQAHAPLCPQPGAQVCHRGRAWLDRAVLVRGICCVNDDGWGTVLVGRARFCEVLEAGTVFGAFCDKLMFFEAVVGVWGMLTWL